MTNQQKFIERAEQARDLKSQMGDLLGQDEDQEFQFYEWSPGRTNVLIWSMETGEELSLPRYMAESALYIRNAEGAYRFTASQEKAPTARLNSVKCFLHRESAERPVLEELGIIGPGEIGCSSAQLANEASKWSHAKNRHGSRYEQYRAELDRIERANDRELQRKQAEAMLTMAGGGRRKPAAETE